MKNTKFLKIVGVLLVGLFIISFSGKAEAATLTILPQASQVSVGDKISLDVKLISAIRLFFNSSIKAKVGFLNLGNSKL